MAAMATSSMPTSLNIPATDDDMEISSDAGRLDHDLDIDIMGSEHGDNDVDWMLHDGEDPEHHQHNDDLMYDDADEITYIEEPMQDDTPARPEAHPEPADLDIEFEHHPATEETLYDATDETEQQTHEIYNQPEEETLIDFDTYSDHGDHLFTEDETGHPYDTAQLAAENPPTDEQSYITQPETTTDEQSEAADQNPDPDPLASETQAPQTGPIVSRSEEHDAHPSPAHEQYHEDQAPPSIHSASSKSPSRHVSPVKEENTFDANLPEPAADSREQVAPGQPPVHLDTSSVAIPGQAGIALDAVHNITVLYGNDQFPLFSTFEDDDPNTYLLQDPVVASSTLIDFFSSCRSVLDDDLTDDYQLEIAVDQLGLTITEDSIHCRDTSLAQIIEVYVNLMRNDGIESPEPLLLHLNIVDRFSAQLTSLFKAASEKKGLSQLGLDQGPSFESDAEQEPTEIGEEKRVEEGAKEEDEEHEGEVISQEDEVYAEVDPVADATGNEALYEAPNDSPAQEEETGSSYPQESIPNAHSPSYDATQQSELPDDGNNDLEEGGYEFIGQPNEEAEAQPEEDATLHQESIADAEHGDGSSSGSSTVQGETQPIPPQAENDASSHTAQPDISVTDEQQLVDAEQDDNEYLDAPAADQEADEAFGHGSEHHTEPYEDLTYNASTFDQEFGAVDFEYHEQPLDEAEHDERVHQDWAFEDPQEGEGDAPPESSGTFQVPDTSEEDEDEITFNDDEFTVGDAATQDTAAQEYSPNSPLGKRSREDDGDDLLDGSDQESKRLKAA